MMIFTSIMDVLHLGGPELCQEDFPSNYTFDDKSSPKINITLCGVPQPQVQGEFIKENLNVLNTTVINYLHNYILQLPQLTQTVCGKELTVTATVKGNEYDGTLSKTTKIFVENCKYFYYSCLFITLVLHHF